MCEVLPATHVLTGCDITCKFGTKAAGITAEPVLYLKDFGRAHTDVQDCVQNAEKFLVQVLNSGCMALKRWIVYVSTGTIIESQ